MKTVSYTVLLCFYSIGYVASHKSSESKEIINKTKIGRLSYLHTIEEDLLQQSWREREEPCLRQLLKIIRNVQNSTLWATWIWDSMQLPVGHLYGSRAHLGNYDQCINFPWKEHPELTTQYCLAELHLAELEPEIKKIDLLDTVQKYLQYRTERHLKFNTMFWGMCVPTVCKTESVSKFVDAMFRSTHLGHLETPVNITVSPEYCQVADEHHEYSTKEYIFVSSVIFLTIICLICTFYVNFKSNDESTSKVLDFAKAFHIKTNVQKLMILEDQSVRCILGIRVITTMLIVAAHLWTIKIIFVVSNAVELNELLKNPLQNIRFNLEMIVDTFFMISGLLLTKALIENKYNTFNPILVVVNRYMRLLRSIIMVIFILPTLLLRGDPAPLAKRLLLNEVDACDNNWWSIVLMIGNYADTEHMCYPILWSLACDFHFFIIGVLLYFIYRKSRRAGMIAYFISAVASIVIPVMYNYVHRSPAVATLDFRGSNDFRKYPMGDPSYVNAHLRAGPFFVGIAIGYLMGTFHPDKYRKAMNKKYSVLAFMAFLAMFISLNIICGMYHIRQYGRLEGALVAVGRRNAFAALIGFLIVICEYGTLPFVSDILGWQGLAPLSKLSYGVYLIHFMVLFRSVSRTRVPLRIDFVDDLFATFSFTALTMVMSLMMHVLWEAPSSKLLNMLIKRFADKKVQNGHVGTNGTTAKKSDAPAPEYKQYNDDQNKKLS